MKPIDTDQVFAGRPLYAESVPSRVVPDATDALESAIARARDRVLADQHADGYWCYELEADATIPAEYILYMHYMDEIDEVLERKLARFLLRQQAGDGGWPLYHGGEAELSCTVKAYYALKLAGQDIQSAPMRRARDCILAAGGAARSNVFTRIALAMFGQIPWRGVPFMPVEIMLLPRWFPFHINRVSYWSRTVMVPLFVLHTLRASAHNPRGVHVQELFTTPPELERDWFPACSGLNRLFYCMDRLGRRLDRLVPAFVRRRALARAERWIVERRNGIDGLGAIFPAMVNASQALALLGYPPQHPFRLDAREALRRLVVDRGSEAYCQPCVSPVWDTALAVLALAEAGGEAVPSAQRRALDWLAGRQVTDAPGDWRARRPDLAGGGWAFQFNNPHYPDLDDSAVVAWAMHRSSECDRYGPQLERAADWLAGMQSENGGFGAFDVDNTYYYLNHIPFADHGALLDPPTADVSARCLKFLADLGRERDTDIIARVRDYLFAAQEDSGAWFGRWGTNYIYGTWSVLVALCALPGGRDLSRTRKAVEWLKSVQRADGGWGEGNDSYSDPARAGQGSCSRAFQTAWALLGLMAAGEEDSDAVARGIDYLVSTQADDGSWDEPWFTAPGFPRVFYLKYHGYHRYFPLWALGAYRNWLQRHY